MEFLPRPGAEQKNNLSPSRLFVCYAGIERSRAAAEGLRDGGIADVAHFTGGTHKLAAMSEAEIQRAIDPQTKIVVIYDQGSKDSEFQAYQKAVDKLQNLGYRVIVWDTARLAIELYSRGININHYL